MDDLLSAMLDIPNLRKKFLVLYLKGCKSPLIIAIADTEATYRKIKKHLSKGDDGKLMKEIIEKKLVDYKGVVYTIPLDQVIAVGIQDLTEDYKDLV